MATAVAVQEPLATKLSVTKTGSRMMASVLSVEVDDVAALVDVVSVVPVSVVAVEVSLVDAVVVLVPEPHIPEPLRVTLG